MRHKEQRVLVLFDVQNMYYSAKHIYNTKVNFKAILDEAVSKRRLVRAISYVINTEIKEESLFHDALNKIGIEVKQKDLQVFYGGSKKGDWDIGIAMDAVRMVDKIDTLVLVSGDGDFKDLLEYMKSHGCRTEVMALGKTASKQLKESADMFIDLESDIKRFLINGKNVRALQSHGNTSNKPRRQHGNASRQTTKKTTKKAESKNNKTVESKDKKTVESKDKEATPPKIAKSKKEDIKMPETDEKPKKKSSIASKLKNLIKSNDE